MLPGSTVSARGWRAKNAGTFHAIAGPGTWARMNSTNASGVETGNRGIVCATMSVRDPSGRYSLTARPRTSGL